MVLFSFASLFGLYYMSILFPSSDLATKNNWNLAAVQKLSSSMAVLTNLNGGQNPNPALVFGDFLVGATVLFSVLSGGGVTTLFMAVPNFDANMGYLVQIMYGSACAVLWVYVIANRSL